MPRETVDILGLEETLAALKTLGAQVEREATKPAIQAGANVVTVVARAEAKKHSPGAAERKITRKMTDPHLFEKVAFRLRTYQKGNVVFAAVGEEAKGAQHAHLVEFGHRMVVGGSVARITGKQKGYAPPTKNKALRGAGRVVGQVPPHPWLRPVFEARKRRALDAITNVFRWEVRKAAEQAASTKTVG